MKENVKNLKEAIGEVEAIVWATCELGSTGREKMNVLINRFQGFENELRAISSKLIPQKQYYDFEVDRILKDILGEDGTS